MRQFSIIVIAAGAVAAASFALVQAQTSTFDSSRSQANSDASKTQPSNESWPTVTPLLMFEGKAEEAMNFYMSLFKNSKAIGIHRWEPG